MKTRLEGKVALVTGASRGIGRSVAESLAAEGVRLALCARGEKALRATAETLRDHLDADVLWKVADVGEKGAIEAVVEAAAERWGGLDILVNNAGGPRPGRFLDFDDSDWRQAFDLSLMSVVWAIQAATPHLKNSPAGRVINVLSTAVQQPLPGMVLSNSLRSAAAGLARTLSHELASDGVTVNNVCPNHIFTGRLRQVAAWRAQIGEAVDPRRTIARIPLGRLGRAREVAALVVFLASEPAGYITGASIPIDGGGERAAA